MQWYYERDGQQVGPVSQTEMVRLIIHRHIQPHTLVWHPGFGDEWRTASRAGFTMPPAGAKVLFSTIGKPKSLSAERKKADPQSVTSLWAWLLLLPGLLNLALLIAGQHTHWAITPDRPATGLCIYVILFLSIIQDRRMLTQAGIKAPSFWWWLFLPGYFLRRRRFLGRGLRLLVCSVLLFVLGNAVLFSNPPPDVQAMLARQKTGEPATSSPQRQPKAGATYAKPDTSPDTKPGIGRAEGTVPSGGNAAQPDEGSSRNEEQIQL